MVVWDSWIVCGEGLAEERRGGVGGGEEGREGGWEEEG